MTKNDYIIISVDIGERDFGVSDTDMFDNYILRGKDMLVLDQYLPRGKKKYVDGVAKMKGLWGNATLDKVLKKAKKVGDDYLNGLATLYVGDGRKKRVYLYFDQKGFHKLYHIFKMYEW